MSWAARPLPPPGPVERIVQVLLLVAFLGVCAVVLTGRLSAPAPTFNCPTADDPVAASPCPKG